jgi:CubicO group peptidase (beta-lactamase class C family)
MEGAKMTVVNTSLRQETQLRERMDRLVQAQGLPGIHHAVVDAQDILFEHTSGWRDIGARLPVTAETTFMASSSTKALTAAAVLQLVEQGKVALDHSLSAYYADHPYGEAVIIRQLLNQTSGIPNPLPLRWLHRVEEHAAFDEASALQHVLAKNSRLRSKPGQRYGYSNISYWLLGKVVEQVTGMPYCEYMRRNIFEPLGASPAELGCEIPDLDQHARGYQPKYTPLGLFVALTIDRSLLERTEAGRYRLRPVYMNGPAYGGLIGTARGFARFLQDQLRARPVLFGKPTRQLFFAAQRDSRGQAIETTLGWHRGEVAGVPFYGKPGGGPGFQSNVRVYPTRGIATVWLANQTGVSEGPINRFTDELDRLFVEGK